MTWFSIGNITASYSIAFDPLTAVMLTAITFIGSWIAIFSIGYMHDDPGYPRFFAALSLFVFSMCMLVMARNFLVLFVFWEAVGLVADLRLPASRRQPAPARGAAWQLSRPQHG